MSFSFMDQLAQQQLVSAICRTLVHSLWLGLLAAALAGGIILGTRRAGAQLRYNLLGATLLLFIVATVVTFFMQLQPGEVLIKTAAHTVATPSTSPIPDVSLTQWVTGFLDMYAAWIVLIWAFCFAFKLIKTGAGLLYIGQLRRRQITTPNAAWRNRFYDLKHDMGIKRVVRLLESELVKVPLTIGTLKPVVLLPLGILAQLPAEQVETILLHELAHIRRKDYLINLLQNITETIFFFNPALLWLSALIREEREACCDDIVLAHTQRKEAYMEALVAFQEFTLTQNSYAMTLKDHPGQLFSRIKRMLTRENEQLGNTGKLLLAAGILALAVLYSTSGNAVAAPVKKPVSHTAVTLQEPQLVKYDTVAPHVKTQHKTGRKDAYTTKPKRKPSQTKSHDQVKKDPVYVHINKDGTWQETDTVIRKDTWQKTDTVFRKKNKPSAMLLKKEQHLYQPDNLRIKKELLLKNPEIALKLKNNIKLKNEINIKKSEIKLEHKLIEMKKIALKNKIQLKHHNFQLQKKIMIKEAAEKPDNMRMKNVAVPQS